MSIAELKAKLLKMKALGERVEIIQDGGQDADCKAARSARLRNCDVGTAEEQAKRMDVYCSMHGKDESGCYRCEKCKLIRVDRCELAWGQMPYEEGGKDGK